MASNPDKFLQNSRESYSSNCARIYAPQGIRKPQFVSLKLNLRGVFHEVHLSPLWVLILILINSKVRNGIQLRPLLIVDVSAEYENHNSQQMWFYNLYQLGLFKLVFTGRPNFCNLPMKKEFVHHENLFYDFFASVCTLAIVENVGKPSGLKAFTQVSSLKITKAVQQMYWI